MKIDIIYPIKKGPNDARRADRQGRNRDRRSPGGHILERQPGHHVGHYTTALRETGDGDLLVQKQAVPGERGVGQLRQVCQREAALSEIFGKRRRQNEREK